MGPYPPPDRAFPLNHQDPRLTHRMGAAARALKGGYTPGGDRCNHLTPEAILWPTMVMTSLLPGLHVAATPIGNLKDVSTRLRDALTEADLVLCEDTRVTGKLLSSLGIKATLRPYHDHNGEKARPEILQELAAGKTIVLVSDAGTPLIADPGYKLVKAARAAKLSVYTLPGPSALTAALSIAGVPTDAFSFAGFVPNRMGARRDRLKRFLDRGETAVFYETGPRLGTTLGEIAEIYGDVEVVIARELTKLHEEVVSGTAAALAEQFAASPPKGEIVLIVPPISAPAASDEDVEEMMITALKSMRLKEASAHVAERTGRKKRDLYQAWRDRTE
ncbi:MAG: 16S rRNA (cytidine(1402)-2'-O)-methyltransferase [Parvularcula sp.]